VQALILIHVVISLVGILTGFVVLFGMLASKRLPRWTFVFLTTTVLTSLTGFILPAEHFMPSHALGILSLLILPFAIFALHCRDLRGSWRWIFVIAAMLAQYLNVFVLIVQLFQKVPALHASAPNQTEGPFKIAQLVVLLLFIALTMLAVIRFHVEQPRCEMSAAEAA